MTWSKDGRRGGKGFDQVLGSRDICVTITSGALECVPGTGIQGKLNRHHLPHDPTRWDAMSDVGSDRGKMSDGDKEKQQKSPSLLYQGRNHSFG